MRDNAYEIILFCALVTIILRQLIEEIRVDSERDFKLKQLCKHIYMYIILKNGPLGLYLNLNVYDTMI